LATAVVFLADTYGGRGGGQGAYSAANTFTLISIMQLKANKHEEQICTLKLEVQTLS
jgi:hypothetical protein